jgi:hypothetical protein
LTCPAVPQDIPREHHAWARFAPGSWKLVRIVTENFDAAGKVTAASTTETKTTLKEAGADGFTLTIESTVEVGGKRIVSEPQQVAQQYNGAMHGQTASFRLAGSEAVTIDGKSYTCRVHNYEINGAGQKTVTQTLYSSEVPPHVLRRETSVYDVASGAVVSRVSVRVKELNVSHMVCGQTHLAARMHVEQKHAKGVETMDALTSPRVPGGVIWHSSVLADAAGVKVSHSKLELVDYHVVPRDEAPRNAQILPRFPGATFCDNRYAFTRFSRSACSSGWRTSRCSP